MVTKKKKFFAIISTNVRKKIDCFLVTMIGELISELYSALKGGASGLVNNKIIVLALRPSKLVIRTSAHFHIRTLNYSVLKLFTGFINAALIAW
jgi:hypothetical protein